MIGDYVLVPVMGVVVGVAVLLDRGVDHVLVSRGRALPAGVYDEDA
jgi:hypothetical protein